MTNRQTASYQFFVGHPAAAIDPSHAQWGRPLPLDRRGTGEVELTHGDYFAAAGDYLAQDRMALPRKIAALELSQPLSDIHIERIQIHLVKHGAFYHPARATLSVAGRPIDFVLNVAVSEAGRRLLPVEVANLQTLHLCDQDNFVPRIYGWGTGRNIKGDPLPMFAGQWFAGFHELHLDGSAPQCRQRFRVWDSDVGAWHMTPKQVASFFRQAVFILTRCFDPRTLGVIMEWHHAAGDFVVKQDEDDIAVRLITVRRYGPFFKSDESVQGMETLIEALTVFFVKTSLWMRLDRYDGVGELAWTEGDVVAPMWNGFVQGLQEMARIHDLPEMFIVAAVRYMARHTRRELCELGSRLLSVYPENLPEVKILRVHFTAHIDRLAAVIQAGAHHLSREINFTV